MREAGGGAPALVCSHRAREAATHGYAGIAEAHQKALLDKETGVEASVSFGKAWAAQEKFAREVETKKGLTITRLSDADIAKLKDMAKNQTDDEVARLEKEGKPAKAFMADLLK